MPLDLTDLNSRQPPERAERLLTKEEQAAKRIENPAMRSPIENTGKRAAALAERFEAVRRRVG